MSSVPVAALMILAPIDHCKLITLYGERCWLKPLSIDNVTNNYVAWLTDPIVNRYLESRFSPNSIDSVRAFVSEHVSSGEHVLLGIWAPTNAQPDGQHVGNIKLGPVNRHHLTADLGFLVGERSCWGRGIASEAIALIVEYGFGLGLRKITAGAYEDNPGSKRALEKAGFLFEGHRPNQVISGDRRVGIDLFGISCS